MRENTTHAISMSTKEAFIKYERKKLALVMASKVISGIIEANMGGKKHSEVLMQ